MILKNRARGASSVVALTVALMAAGQASAQCAPDTVPAGGTIICSGIDPNGLITPSTTLTVRVQPGASVFTGADAAISSFSQSMNLVTDGSISGGANPGVLVRGAANISIGSTGSISGASAIRLRSGGSQVFVNIESAGQLLGTAGPALIAETGTYFNNVYNNAGGTIGAISGRLNFLRNSGVLDGGSLSAISATIDNAQASNINNEIGAIIRSASTTATLDLASRGVANLGRIDNSGSGAAIASNGSMIISNGAGARISSAGPTAITLAGPLTLTNAGTIVGSVLITGNSTSPSTIDTVSGTIQGNLILGAGDDILRARYDVATGRVSSISGLVDGGAGTDSIYLGISANATLASPILPTNFERLGLDLSNNAVATLAPGFVAANGLLLSGTGTLINTANLTTNGPALSGNPPGTLSFTNQGIISSTLSTSTLAAVGTINNVINNGMISATGGDGVRAFSGLINTGRISATGTAAAVNFGMLTNNGEIISGAGIGATLTSASSTARSTNGGTISGATTGATVSQATLINNNIISGGNVGISLGSNGILINQLNGVITGGATGINNSDRNVRVINAGVINGSVNLVSLQAADFSNDIFVDDGGTVNGTIRLGGGDDLLVTNLVQPANRPFAGATGGLDAGSGIDTLRYRVKADAQAFLALPPGFEGLSYELDNRAVLTLTATQPLATSLGLAGNGTVILNGSISATDATLIDTMISSADQLTGTGTGPLRDLSIINNGTLSLTLSQLASSTRYYVVNAGTSSFTNAGVINLTNAASASFPGFAVFSGATVRNDGTINLVGGTAVSNATNIINTGLITDRAGSGGIGIAQFTSLLNSGTIRVDRTAVSIGSNARITNSGTIESRLAEGLLIDSNTILTNEATGLIIGKTAALTLSGGVIVNRGTIMGDLTSVSPGRVAYFADGGSVTGAARFGSGNDLFVQYGTGGNGVTGLVDGGLGSDVYGYALRSTAQVMIGYPANVTNFENALVQAIGADTVVTVDVSAGFAGNLYVGGLGAIVNRGAIKGAVIADTANLGATVLPDAGSMGSFTNSGSILGTITGRMSKFANSGTIGDGTFRGTLMSLQTDGAFSFLNSGQIIGSGLTIDTVVLAGVDTVSATNSGTIAGTLRTSTSFAVEGPTTRSSVTNTGSLLGNGTVSAYVQASAAGAGGAVSVDNSGIIRSTANLSMTAAMIALDAQDKKITLDLRNSGTIATVISGTGPTTRATGLSISGNGDLTANIINTSTGTISATAARTTAISASATTVNLDNAGTILGSVFLFDSIAAIHNSGSITGDITAGTSDDRIENYGSIIGNVFLGSGNDSFTQWVGGLMNGTVDGGDGLDTFTIDATGGGAVNSAQFINFERFTQIGSGTLAYSGTFGASTIELNGSSANVVAGATVSSAGPVTFTGGAGAEQIVNAGIIGGGISLGGGNDMIENRGSIGGAISLGDGNDSFTDGAGSVVNGLIDGGTGTDTYLVELAGNRTGLLPQTNFEQLGILGSGTLSLTLNQNWSSINLAGTGLDLRLAGFTPGSITGGATAETVIIDGDVASVSLGGGNDALNLGGNIFAGRYDGGTGSDRLAFTGTGPVTLSGTATGFETIALAGGDLRISGNFGASGETATFATGSQTVRIDGPTIGSIIGNIDLGDGADTFIFDHFSDLNGMVWGGLAGTIFGGSGTDTAILASAQRALLDGDKLQQFETLRNAANVLTITRGTARFDLVDFGGGNLFVASGAALQTGTVNFADTSNLFAVSGSFSGQANLGGGDDILRLDRAQAFSGSADGGAGTDRIEIFLQNSDAAPLALGTGSFTNFESLVMQAGVATYGGSSTFGTMSISGGRLIGLAGSRFTASTIDVAAGATFGSAGTVVGNIAVAGTLSPGASPGTMTVTGNVSLAGSSTSLFELTPTISDQLLISGTLNIAAGATLTLTGTRPLTPGVTLDLITANGGISGSFTTINKPSTIQGFLSQSATKLSLLGTFLTDTGFSPQINATITYLNNVLIAGQASPALIAAVPDLLTSSGTSNAAAFQQLSPEAYASASQLGTEQALSIVEAARTQIMMRPTANGMFAFGQILTNHRNLKGDTSRGISGARLQTYGGMAGIGIAADIGWIGAFVGYHDGHQSIGGLATRTDSSGIIAGLQGQLRIGAFSVDALAAYSGGDAETNRTVLKTPVFGHYDLDSWIGDLRTSYALPLSDSWAVRPSLGITGISTTRGAVTEAGNSPFALTVLQDRKARWFFDGDLTLQGGLASADRFHPFASLGFRRQFKGRNSAATAAYANVATSYRLAGLERDETLATAHLGLSYDATSRLSFFVTYGGEFADDVRHNGSAGLRLRM